LDQVLEKKFILDRTHAYIARSVDGAVKWFDGFFTPPREQLESTYSYIILKNIYLKTESEKWEYKPRMKAKVHLPGIERRLSLIVEGDEREDFQTSQEALGIDTDTGVPLDENSRNREVGIQYTAARWVKSRIDFRVAFRTQLRPKASARYRKKIALARDIQLRFTQTPYWKYSDGFGETTRLDFEKQLNPLMVFRTTPSKL